MVEKRKLQGKELIMAMSGLKNKEEEKDWLLYQLEYYKLMLDKGLEMNYKKNIRDFKQHKHEFEGELSIVENHIKILQSQIRNGVDFKDKQEEDKKEDKINGK